MKKKIEILVKNNIKNDKWKSENLNVDIHVSDWFGDMKTKKTLIVDGSLVSVGTFSCLGIRDNRIKQGMFFVYNDIKYLIENVDNTIYGRTKIEGIEM